MDVIRARVDPADPTIATTGGAGTTPGIAVDQDTIDAPGTTPPIAVDAGTAPSADPVTTLTIAIDPVTAALLELVREKHLVRRGDVFRVNRML